MKIKINGKNESIDNISTIADIVSQKKLVPERIVVEHNLSIVPKDRWHEAILREEDNVEIISFVGGG